MLTLDSKGGRSVLVINNNSTHGLFKAAKPPLQ